MAKLTKEELHQIKLKAQNEFKEEKTEKIVNKLKDLYEELYLAEKVVSNIKGKIEDYEMEISQ